MIKILYYIFGIAVSVIALLLIVSAFPIKGNYQVLIVLSGSMEPSIKTGSLVVVKPVSQYNIGDVVTFGPVSKTKVPITHRIVDIRIQNGRSVYVTKGDANEEKATRAVLAKDVVGKAFFDVPFLGYALAAAKKPVGFGVLIAVPAIIILFDEGKKIFSEIKKMRKKKEEEISQ